MVIMSDPAKEIKEHGYTILRGALSQTAIQEARNAVVRWFRLGHRGFANEGGSSVPDFIRIPALAPVAKLKECSAVREALTKILGPNHRFCSHNDIGVGRVVGWHKDKLNGEYSRFQKTDIWKPSPNGEQHEIVKVLIYLQPQHDVDTSLRVVPGSHRNPKINSEGEKVVRLEAGDVLVFDQRITHRGAARCDPNRILVAFGFGKNNMFTDEFERGTRLRQQRQYVQMNSVESI